MDVAAKRWKFCILCSATRWHQRAIGAKRQLGSLGPRQAIESADNQRARRLFDSQVDRCGEYQQRCDQGRE